MDVTDTLSGDQPVSAPVPKPPATKVPVTRMSYHGKAGQIFRLHIMNLLMNIITIGIYSFWGKTRIRRYMTSHISIAHDRFEYTGTGKELFFGWLKAMLIFLPLLVCMSTPFVNIPAFFVFMAILSVALFLALRYRLSRTKFRGIRFRLDGSIKEYFILSLKRTLINIFTLGIKIPKSDVMLWSYIANHMSYGDLKFSYKGDVSRLRKIHYITLSILIVAFVVGIGTIGASGFSKGQEMIERAKVAEQAKRDRQVQSAEDAASGMSPDAVVPVEDVAPQAGSDLNYQNPYASDSDRKTKAPRPELEPEMVVGIMIFYLLFGIGMLSRLWYKAALWQERFRGLYLGGLRFKADVTGGGLAKLYITNMLIIIFTLGLGKPIAVQRVLRYYVTNMRIGGDLKELVARQEALKQKSGMGDALAADVGFDIGL